MTYTRQRFGYVLKVFRRAKAADERHVPSSPQVDRNLRNKHEFRGQLQLNPPATPGSRWQDENSGSEDDDYDPSAKKSKKKAPEKPTRSKRKAPDAGDGEKTRKKPKLRGSSPEELNSKVAFISVKMASNKGRELLKSLADAHGTGIDAYRSSGAGRSLSDADMDTMAWENKQRKQHERTFEDAFNAEIGGIDNHGGRALRNRKVPDIAVFSKTLKDGSNIEEQSGMQAPQNLDDEPPHKASNAAISTTGLLSPAPTPPKEGRRLYQSSRQRSSSRSPILISDDGQTPSPLPPTFDKIAVTRWHHPVDFQTRLRTGCDFCKDCLFGVHGLIARKVQLRKTGTINKRYTECGGATPPTDSHGPTKMCIPCALDRFYISNCHKHELRVLPYQIGESKQPPLRRSSVVQERKDGE